MRRILIVRTDRLGDVVLSTPVIKAARKTYPDGFIAMMVTPYTRDIVEGNPYLDETIVFDKKRYAGLSGSVRFSALIKEKKFDTAVVLHPVRRVHVILFMAGIKKRVGYDKKWGFLLTDRVPHGKQSGEKHELDYNLDLARAAGISADSRELFVAVGRNDRTKVDSILRESGFLGGERFVVVHPAASCRSKRWPAARFAEAADMIIGRFRRKIVIVTSMSEKVYGNAMRKSMNNEALDLSGCLSVKEMAALLERSSLLVSNDSGPVHVAAALGVQCVVIFGRKQAGLGYRRWGPVGCDNIVLHKDAGCAECLAHDCKIGFKCLEAVTVEEVVEAAGKLLDASK